jgi:hypothetical protein
VGRRHVEGRGQPAENCCLLGKGPFRLGAGKEGLNFMERKWTKGKWQQRGSYIYGPDPKRVAVCQVLNMGERGQVTRFHADAALILAAPDLYAAAELVCLMFKRKNMSNADADWLGDDEHEAWTALRKAMAKARGEL